MLSTALVKPILESMYECRSEMVPCFIGAPGIGKTQGLYEFAKEKGVNVVTFILSNTVPSEVSGIRMPDPESKRMEVFDDMRMASLKDGDILFFDEILEAPPMLWSACLTLIQDRIMASGRKLPDVFIVAASNKVASPGIIPASTRDRFQFIELKFDFYHWCDWFEDKYGIRPAPSFGTLISEDSDSYNILTPRRVVKLYEWLKAGDEREVKKKVITDMFDASTTQHLVEMAIGGPSPKKQIKDVVLSIDPDIDLPQDFEKLNLFDILTILQSQDSWDEIAKTLANIELVETKDNIEY